MHVNKNKGVVNSPVFREFVIVKKLSHGLRKLKSLASIFQIRRL